MRVVVIGGTGHIGSYLVPRLVSCGYETVCVSRRQRQPYVVDERWTMVEHAVIDRALEEQRGQFGERIAALHPNVVIDLTCYTLDSAVQLANALAGRVDHLIHCGTIWVHGPSVEVPTTEDAPRRPFGDYGCRKAAIEAYLLDQAASYAGTRIGFDLALTRAVSDAVAIPVIASGGVGALEHLSEGIRVGGADAVLAASIFHYGEFTVRQAKVLLARDGIPVRP